MTQRLHLGVLLSGGGRTLENLLKHVAQPPPAVPGACHAGRGADAPAACADGSPPVPAPEPRQEAPIPAEVVVVIASRPGIRGIEIAHAAGIPTHVIRSKEHPTIEAYSDAMVRILDVAHVDLVCLAGFLSYWIIPDRYLGRVMNIHPALLPAFGGHGMYGHRVHEAVLKRGCRVSGCTVHFVDNAYDEGPIILQRPVPAYGDDTPDDLAARVFEQECIAYPEAIRLFAEGRLRVAAGVVHVDDPGHRRE